MIGSAVPPRRPSLAVLSLRPISEAAKEVVAHTGNRHLLWTDGGRPAIAIGHVRSTVNSDTLASIGRNADILVHSGSISQIQCTFELHPRTGRILIHDRSRLQTTQIFGSRCKPFTAESRSTVVEPGDRIDLGFGGIGCDLYQFEILWHASGADIAKRLTTNAKLRDNPRTALTAEDIDLGPTQLQTPRHGMRTRIHAPASPAPSYRTEESIGAGAFGQVFRVHDLNNGAKMALKVLRAPPMDTAQYTDWYQNLKREVETLSRVKHENIISIIGTENLNTNQPRLFMPLMDGTLESLAAKRECAGYEKDLCNRMTHHMLQALDYLQIHNIIHRDIKPANILYKRTEGAGYRFVLGDFGLCNNTVLAETRGKGTPLFMAPEVFDSTAGGYMQSARSDMWSLFVTIIWTLNLNDFRRAAASLTGSCHSRTAMEKCWRLVWATSHKIPAWQPMCEVDPERRPSAAELLFRHFEGKGLLTPQRRIPWVKVSPPAEEARGKPSTEAEGPAYALGSGKRPSRRQRDLDEMDCEMTVPVPSRDTYTPQYSSKRSGKAPADRAPGGRGEASSFLMQQQPTAPTASADSRATRGRRYAW